MKFKKSFLFSLMFITLIIISVPIETFAISQSERDRIQSAFENDGHAGCKWYKDETGNLMFRCNYPSMYLPFDHREGDIYWVKQNRIYLIQSYLSTLTSSVDALDTNNAARTMSLRIKNTNNNNIVAESQHNFNGSNSSNKTDLQTSLEFTINKASRSYKRTNTLSGVFWYITPKLHGETYLIQKGGTFNKGFKPYDFLYLNDFRDEIYISVDGKAPNATIVDENIQDNELTLSLSANDPDSGIRRINYEWSRSSNVPSSLSDGHIFNTFFPSPGSYNFTASLNEPGPHYLHVRTVDAVYNEAIKTFGPFEFASLMPEARFYPDPGISDRVTSVKMVNETALYNSEIADKLTYDWEYMHQNENSWTHFSNEVHPEHVFDKIGVYGVRLTVSQDDGQSDSTTRIVRIFNSRPTADFDIDTTPSDRLTPVLFTNKSNDPEGDKLTYRWQYKHEKDSGWTNMSTATNPTHEFNKVGTYEVRLTTTDEYNASHSIIKEVEILNIAPEISISYSPTELYEGDSTTITIVATDDDFDPIDIELFISKDGGTYEKVFTETNATHGRSYTYTINNLDPIHYDVRAVVTDSFGDTGEDELDFRVTPLIIKGKVTHTERWKDIHELLGNEDDIFFSGERFILSSKVTNNSVANEEKDVEVEVTFEGVDLNDTPHKLVEILNETSRTSAIIEHEGEMYEEFMTDPKTQLKSDTVMYFDFKATWSNGVVKHDIVPITITDGVYDFYKLHRTN